MNTRTHIRISLLILLGAFGLTGLVKAQEHLPPFEFEHVNGGLLRQQDLPKGRTVFVLFFSPDCDHCNRQAQLIQAELPLFRQATLVWVNAFHEVADIRAFQQKYFAGQPNFYFGKDNDWRFDSYFGESQVPSIYVYNPAGDRIASFVPKEGEFEEVEAQTLARLIQ